MSRPPLTLVPEPEYQCPSEPARISRAVHLARLSEGYPACRQCRYREDTEGLTERTQRKIPVAEREKRAADFLEHEGLAGNLHEGFDAELAGRFAAGFGLVLREETGAKQSYPSVALAGDGRAVTQRHLAEAAERLRWAGCDVVDLGTVPSPALSWSIGEVGADGGLYVGNPQGDPHRAGIHFYGREGRPLSEREFFEAVCAWAEKAPDRPVRSYGKAGKIDALSRYERRYADSFHGLRPLRFLLHTTNRPLGVCLGRLLQATACRIVLRQSETGAADGPISEAVGHFAAAIDDDGRRCRLWDEGGRQVPFEKLLLLAAQTIARRAPIVVQEELRPAARRVLEARGFAVQGCGPLPSQMHAGMVAGGAWLGGDRRGRLWYREPGGAIVADGLATLTVILGRLSQGDRSMSEVLDADGGPH